MVSVLFRDNLLLKSQKVPLHIEVHLSVFVTHLFVVCIHINRFAIIFLLIIPIIEQIRVRFLQIPQVFKIPVSIPVTILFLRLSFNDWSQLLNLVINLNCSTFISRKPMLL